MLLFKNGINFLKAFVFTLITEKTILVKNCVRVNENYPLVLLCSEMCETFLRYVGHAFRLVCLVPNWQQFCFCSSAGHQSFVNRGI
jgi:hypothetical protein